LLAEMREIRNERNSLELPLGKGTPGTNEEKIDLFLSLFGARRSVYPKLWINPRNGSKSYSPACSNEWLITLSQRRVSPHWRLQLLGEIFRRTVTEFLRSDQKDEIMDTKFPTLKNQLLLPILAVTLSCAICLPLKAESTEPKCCSEMSASTQMGSFFKDTLQQHEDLLKLIKSQDAELAVQLDQIKSASADQKLDIVTTTLTLLIQQQSAQHNEMQKMLEKAKLQIEKGTWSKAQCRMMQDMSNKDKAPREPNTESEQKTTIP